MVDAKPLRTDFMFDDDQNFGHLWRELWTLENELGTRLLDHPIGTMVVSGDDAWVLRDIGDELVIVHGNWSEGHISDETSRYDFDLDWTDVDETDLSEGISRLQHALLNFEALLQSA